MLHKATDYYHEIHDDVKKENSVNVWKHSHNEDYFHFCMFFFFFVIFKLNTLSLIKTFWHQNVRLIQEASTSTSGIDVFLLFMKY